MKAVGKYRREDCDREVPLGLKKYRFKDFDLRGFFSKGLSGTGSKAERVVVKRRANCARPEPA